MIAKEFTVPVKLIVGDVIKEFGLWNEKYPNQSLQDKLFGTLLFLLKIPPKTEEEIKKLKQIYYPYCVSIEGVCYLLCFLFFNGNIRKKKLKILFGMIDQEISDRLIVSCDVSRKEYLYNLFKI